jgi:mRNA interferase MazF
MRRGEIYFVDLGPRRGREPAFPHPVLVLSINMINNLPLVITVIPGTSAKPGAKNYPLTNVLVPAAESGLPKDTVFKCFQITVVDKARFVEPPAGRISSSFLKQVEDQISFVLGLEPPSRTERQG